MKIPLDSAGSVILDLEKLIVSRGLLQANSGGGKSWALRRILEQSHGHIQQIVIDPEDEFYTLREKYEYILIRHEDGDGIPDVRSAELLAIRLLELGVSAIISLYELMPKQRREFVKLFLNAMVNAPKNLHHKCLVVLDEAHEFAPEAGKGARQKRDESGGCVDAVIGLMSKGRKRGFCGFLATQRISKLNKDAAAEANNKFIGRCTLDVDRDRAGAELGMRTTEEKLTLRAIEPGDFFCFGPAVSNDILPVRFGGVKTTHPEAGAAPTPVAPPKHKVKSILDKLADIPKEAEQERATVADLQKKIRELQSQPRVTATEVSEYSKTIERLERELAEKAQPEAVEVPILTPTEIKQMKNADAAIAKQLSRVAGALESVTNILPKILEQMQVRDKRMAAVETLLSAKPLSRVAPVPRAAFPKKLPDRSPLLTGESSAPPHEARGDTGDTVTSVMQRILNALAELEQLGARAPKRQMVAILAGYTHTASTGFAKALSNLSSQGYAAYPGGGTVALTEQGRQIAVAPIRPSTPKEVQERVFQLLGGKTAEILKPIVDAYPNEVPRTDVMTASGYSNLASTGFTKALSRLSSLGFVTYPGRGTVKASPILFLEQ